jgi:hypothetical protein
MAPSIKHEMKAVTFLPKSNQKNAYDFEACVEATTLLYTTKPGLKNLVFLAKRTAFFAYFAEGFSIRAGRRLIIRIAGIGRTWLDIPWLLLWV